MILFSKDHSDACVRFLSLTEMFNIATHSYIPPVQTVPKGIFLYFHSEYLACETIVGVDIGMHYLNLYII